MNLLTNVKAFYVVGAAIAVIMVVGLILTGRGTGDPADADDIEVPSVSPTATVDPSATATPTATPDPKRFTAAEDVTDAAAETYRAIIKTSLGDITIDLNADVAPDTVNNFVFLAENDFYDGVTFHRVAPNFVVQAGDPDGTGAGNYPGYTTEEEPNELRNVRGALSMAKAGNATVFGSQFFINLKDNPALDFDANSPTHFYPFAEVVEGMDVVDAMAQVELGPNEQGRLEKPVEPITITDVIIERTPKPGVTPTAESTETATETPSATPTP